METRLFHASVSIQHIRTNSLPTSPVSNCLGLTESIDHLEIKSFCRRHLIEHQLPQTPQAQLAPGHRDNWIPFATLALSSTCRRMYRRVYGDRRRWHCAMRRRNANACTAAWNLRKMAITTATCAPIQRKKPFHCGSCGKTFPRQ